MRCAWAAFAREGSEHQEQEHAATRARPARQEEPGHLIGSGSSRGCGAGPRPAAPVGRARAPRRPVGRRGSCGAPRRAAPVRARRRPRRDRRPRPSRSPAAARGSTPRCPVPDVVDAVRRVRDVGGGEVGRRDVADVDEVAGLRAVAEHDGPATGEQPLAEDCHDPGVAGRVLARAVDVAVAQGHDVEPGAATGTSRRTPRPPACSARRPTAGRPAPSPGSGSAPPGCRSRRRSRCSPPAARPAAAAAANTLIDPGRSPTRRPAGRTSTPRTSVRAARWNTRSGRNAVERVRAQRGVADVELDHLHVARDVIQVRRRPGAQVVDHQHRRPASGQCLDHRRPDEPGAPVTTARSTAMPHPQRPSPPWEPGDHCVGKVLRHQRAGDCGDQRTALRRMAHRGHKSCL